MTDPLNISISIQIITDNTNTSSNFYLRYYIFPIACF